ADGRQPGARPHPVTRALLLAALLAWQAAGPVARAGAEQARPLHDAERSDTVTREFTAFEGAEAYLTLVAGCARCDWGADGREAAVLKLSVDGVYSQHVVLARGETPAEFPCCSPG